MSFREEDKKKENLGLGAGAAVAAAIGVGVGAALYYFINRRTENPTASGSTAQGWTCESQQHTLHETEELMDTSDDSYSTVSEHSTSDTSILEDSFSCKCTVYNNSDSDTFECDCEYDSSLQFSQNSYESVSYDADNDVSESVLNDLNDSDLSEWDASMDYSRHERPLPVYYIEKYAQRFMSQRGDTRNDEMNSCGDEAL